ncbi:cation:proton antiporter domain-containing protein [Mycobacterium persicum]|nr:cation:proton antiporter [Mycobacterium persicum]VAZ76587.1 Na(+)/H(+)-K(+) antiporter GerN [Mycobacterium persicum]VAZ84283.1 Na(+)/H(+)-K(+) antiporter GerN [Mycobacterium persicum]VAZ95170.1 Na(+)/H(+)-K(+) antiporter GerN [Mycobacterium persicum]
MDRTFALVLLDVVVIVVTARLFGKVAPRLGQPAVIGEVLAGIALGPSLLGLLPGHLDTRLFPGEVMPYLKMLAELGLVLFVFMVGLELDFTLIRGRRRAVASISLLSFAAPFVLGLLVTLVLHPRHHMVDGKQVPLSTLMLLMGIAMSITAFPVLARIIAERKVYRTRVGVLALSAAAVDDVLAWTLLAYVCAIVKGNGVMTVLRILMLSALFAALMLGVARPLLARMVKWHQKVSGSAVVMLAVVAGGALLSAFITARIGIHEICGAFLFGAIMPRQGAQPLRRVILDRLGEINSLLLLPVFFVIAGFSVNLRTLSRLDLALQLLLVLTAAGTGKLGGTFAGARLQRISAQHSAAIAVLMNTRGLTELVVLSVGKEVGIFDTDMFTIMVVMALATTVFCQPALRIVYPDKAVQEDIDAAATAEPDS